MMTLIYKDTTGFWVEGIRKRKLPWYADRVPKGFSGFIKLTAQTAVLYNPDWSIHKTIRQVSPKK